MGRIIYFTDKEIDMLIEYVTEAEMILAETEGAWEQIENDLNNGLGSSMRKLYKGRIGEARYSKYKTQRKENTNSSEGKITNNNTSFEIPDDNELIQADTYSSVQRKLDKKNKRKHKR